jgi:hypothetical protein
MKSIDIRSTDVYHIVSLWPLNSLGKECWLSISDLMWEKHTHLSTWYYSHELKKHECFLEKNDLWQKHEYLGHWFLWELSSSCENDSFYLSAFSSGKTLSFWKLLLFKGNGEPCEYFGRIQSVLEAGMSFTLFPYDNLVSMESNNALLSAFSRGRIFTLCKIDLLSWIDETHNLWNNAICGRNRSV